MSEVTGLDTHRLLSYILNASAMKITAHQNMKPSVPGPSWQEGLIARFLIHHDKFLNHRLRTYFLTAVMTVLFTTSKPVQVHSTRHSRYAPKDFTMANHGSFAISLFPTVTFARRS
eukprot:309552-Hanusia_phi.AAC.1